MSEPLSILVTLAESYSASVVVDTHSETWSLVCPPGRRWCATESDLLTVCHSTNSVGDCLEELSSLLGCGTEPREGIDPMQINTDDWITVSTAANLRGISRQAGYKWAKRNPEKTVYIDGILFVRRSFFENEVNPGRGDTIDPPR